MYINPKYSLKLLSKSETLVAFTNWMEFIYHFRIINYMFSILRSMILICEKRPTTQWALFRSRNWYHITYMKSLFNHRNVIYIALALKPSLSTTLFSNTCQKKHIHYWIKILEYKNATNWKQYTQRSWKVCLDVRNCNRSWKEVSQMVQITAQDLLLSASYCIPLLPVPVNPKDLPLM
jgi:hypothetical protein